MFRLIFSLLLVFSIPAFAQKEKLANDQNDPHTILWKISGKDCKQPSYLLGTCHALRADWLYTFPEIKKVVENCDHLITESIDDSDNKIAKPEIGKLRAVDIMTPDQYKTLDSFFVARVGEGIKDNPDAEEMYVKAMTRAILQTLLVDNSGEGISLIMDSDLYKYYKQNKKPTSSLENQDSWEFDSTSIDKAKIEINRFVGLVRRGNDRAWNRIDTTSAAGEFINSYKKMRLGYHFNQPDPDNEIGDGGTVQERNYNWMPEIKNRIRSYKSCLIAVGFGHLQYKTGVINFLRESGYTVEPVKLSRAE